MPAQGNPTPPLVGGNSVRSTILESYVFQSGIHKPEHSSILTWKYPQYYLTSLLDRLGSYEPVAQDVFSWNILDRTRDAGTASSVTGVPGTSATFEITEFDFTATNLGGLVVGDIVQTETRALLRVTAVAVSTVLSNKQKVTVAKHNGGTISTTDLASGMKFGHVFNAFGEASDAPDGRLWLPTEDYNVTQILRRSFRISGSEFTNRTYLGDGKAWYWTVEDIHRKEFARDREALVLFGQLNATGVKTTRGILDWVLAQGVVSTYASASGVSEADIIEHMRKLKVEGGSSTYIVLCGSKYFRDVQVAMRDYFVSGGISLGSFDSNKIGLNVSKYEIFGITAAFVLYELFEDQKMVPTPASGSPSSTAFDYSHFSLWLDLGSDSSGSKLIKLKYKEHGGFSRKFIQKLEVGMMNPTSSDSEGGLVASGFDGFRIHMLSEIGVEVRLANRMGVQRANS
jgi:hypothetical protein